MRGLELARSYFEEFGRPMLERDFAERGVLVHGDVLQVGEAALRLRLFSGLKFRRPARKAPAEEKKAKAPKAANGKGGERG